MPPGIQCNAALGLLLGVAIGCAGLSLPHPAAAAIVYDLRADWSDGANPNGVWSYREDSLALPHVAAWESGIGSFASPQPGWARSESSTSRIPFWFKSSAAPTFAHDWLAGDVLVHTRDDANGIGTGEANVAWTSPVSGTIDVSGSVWIGRDIGRSNDWGLWLNSTLLTSGTVASGDAYDRASPFDLAAGSGGAAALADVAVAPGDVLMLRVARTSQYGDFVGVNLRVTASEAASVPVLPQHGAILLGALLLACALLRDARYHPRRVRGSADPRLLRSALRSRARRAREELPRAL